MTINRRGFHLAAGLILLSYVFMHLLNHGVGVVSLDAMNAVRRFLITPWSTAAGITVLGLAAGFHLFSALWVVFHRRTLRMPTWQWSQLLLGLSIPILVAEHAIATAYARLVYDVQPNYEYILLIFWHFDPLKAWVQMGLLCAAWGHACFGIHHWLKVKPNYLQWRTQLYALAVLLPVVSVMGFISAGLDVRAAAQDPNWIFDVIRDVNYPGNDAALSLFEVRDQWIIGYVALVVGVIVLRLVRPYLQRKTDAAVIVHKPSGQKVQIEAGATVLEALRAAEIPHASICGGRARCSTCRIRLTECEQDAFNPPTSEEQKILRRLRLPTNVRLACQTRPIKPVTCEPLLPPDVTMSEAMQTGRFTAGHEVELTVMFADLRGFTALSEHKLPFDVVYLLNQYFEYMGKVIEEAGGTIDKFIGDGIMATFGGENAADKGARAALIAARRMSEELDEMNERLKNDLTEPLRLGIGLHAGPVIRGAMGYGSATQVTVIGDTVNAASRLEAATKRNGVQLLFSEDVFDAAEIEEPSMEITELRIRGRENPMRVYALDKVSGAFTSLSP